MHYSTDGLLALRFFKSIAIARGDGMQARAFVEGRKDWSPSDRDAIVSYSKAAVSGLDTADVGGGGMVPADLMEAIRPLAVVTRLPLRRVPPRVPTLVQTIGARGFWVGEGAARRMCVGSFTRDPGLRLKSVAALMVATNEMLADRTIEGDKALLADLLAACVQALDEAFLDRSNTGSDAVPASITSGATPIVFSGGTVADLDEALRTALQQLAATSNLRAASWIMSSALAGSLGLQRAADGSFAFPGLGALGGQLAGLPVVTSAAAVAEASSDDTEDITLVDASQVSYADDLPDLRTSQDAAIEMSDAPTGDTTTPTAASQYLVGMWQSECTGLKAVLHAAWKLRRAGAVQVISGVPLSGFGS